MQPAPEMLELIEAAKILAGLPSDMALDRACGVRNQVCRWRQGAYFPGDDVAVKLVHLAGRDPQEVLALIAAMDAEKHQQADAARAWRSIVKRLAAATMALPVVLSLMPGFGSQPARAQVEETGAGVYYGKRRRFLRYAENLVIWCRSLGVFGRLAHA